MSTTAPDIFALPARKPRILNHDILNCTHDSVVGNHLYSGRALGASEPGDKIQLHPQLRPQWPAITAHYQRIGLRHSTDVVWDVSYHQLAKYPRHQVSVFFFDDAVAASRQDVGWSRVVSYINNKNNFMHLAEALGMEAPRTRCYLGPGLVTDFGSLPYPCYVKASVSVSGAGIYRCENEAEVRDALATYAPDTPLQIQEEVETELFLNMQYEVVDGALYRLLVTDQVLDGFVHQGNRYPSEHAPWDAVEPMARWMTVRGMKGIFAFDVAVVKSADGFRYLPIECNPRFNGASYPTAVALKLGVENWTAVQLETRHRHLVHLDLRGIEYDPDNGDGVVMVNWGPVLAGKVGFLLAGSPDQQKAFRLELERRL